jgi:hypothetical protein
MDYRVLGAVLSSKAPGPDSVVTLHQDWTVVDERRHVAFMAWIPLVDTNRENGTLEVLPGSHRVFRGLRAPTLRSPLKGHEAKLLGGLEPLTMRAGDVVIMHNALAHFSAPNLTTSPRPAVVVRGCSRDARIVFHYANPGAPEGQVERFEVGDEFVQEFDSFFVDCYERPRFGRSVGFVEHTPREVTPGEVDEYLAVLRARA